MTSNKTSMDDGFPTELYDRNLAAIIGSAGCAPAEVRPSRPLARQVFSSLAQLAALTQTELADPEGEWGCRCISGCHDREDYRRELNATLDKLASLIVSGLSCGVDWT